MAPSHVVASSRFNFAVIVQEFVRGVARADVARARRPTSSESIPVALMRLVDKSRRRYGGYIVHIGIVVMFLGFTGKAWGTDTEASLAPGDKIEVKDYTLTYAGPRREVDPTKMMIFADLDVTRAGKPIGRMSPGKFIYKRSQMSPTTEVAMRRSFRDDLYVVVGMVSPETKRASFQVHVNPLVSWIWTGVLILIAGAGISLWPEMALKEVGAWAYVRTATAAASGIMFAIWIAMGPSMAYGATRPEKSEAKAPVVTPFHMPDDAPLLPIGLALSLGGGIGIASAVRKKRART